VTGEWTGTMNLTEPQAGSDVGALKTRAVRQGAHYRITGQKIFITWGEHDCAENIIHMVLARLPGAPAGTKGISLFIVPKFLVKDDGSLGARNDLRCVSLESKLGIHASPTCLMAYGDSEGAIGYLVGRENEGMACMFTMMNNARLGVGVQGLAVAERAYQGARTYARDRLQGRAIDGDDPKPVAILQHPDVRRMLTTMRARIEAMRALAYVAAADLDRAKRAPDAAARSRAQARVDLLTPLVKSWLTDGGCEVASTALQVHGGMGFIEETGAAQHYRDARITPIYEGTNGIQALDLIGRKLLRDRGAAARDLFAEIRSSLTELETASDARVSALCDGLGAALKTLEEATDWMLQTGARDLRRAAAGATPYQSALSTLLGGWLLARGAAAAAARLSGDAPDASFLSGKIATARVYVDNILPRAAADAAAATGGAESTLALTDDQL